MKVILSRSGNNMNNPRDEFIETKKKKVLFFKEKLKALTSESNLEIEQLHEQFKDLIQQEYMDQMQELDFLAMESSSNLLEEIEQKSLQFLEDAAQSFGNIEGTFPLKRSKIDTWQIHGEVQRLKKKYKLRLRG
jgi:hypothetical protein